MATPKILIVEDVPQISESLVDVIQMKGWVALTANTGQLAIDTAMREHPDLILLDIRLPDMDGYSVYRRIRSDQWGARARFLVITASESTATIAEHIDLPPDQILFKPEWSLRDLLTKIETLIS
jgi:DNA-binding response OmpR family regulator